MFNIHEHPAFYGILREYPGAEVIAARLQPSLRKDGFILERELRRFSQHADPRLREHFRFVPPYLRDLLFKVVAEYTDYPGTYIQLLGGLLSEVQHQVLFLTLNYDTFLEKAVTLYDPTLGFSNLATYIKGDRQVKIVKLHGSINWFKRIGSGRDLWRRVVGGLEINTETPQDDIRLMDVSVQGYDPP
ncbi:MAG: SIR2 family protein [Chloroflexi bacterium]|nr:SIR2 family protein [Chloroflexota bacterium]